MARLHEHQGKAVLKAGGIEVPRGGVAASPEDAAIIARGLGGPVVVKIQAWTTGRKAMGGVVFAASEGDVRDAAKRLLAMKVGHFPVSQVLVEEQLNIAHELFVSLTIDDSTRRPMLLIAGGGGTGIEERAATVSRIHCDVTSGPGSAALAAAIAKAGVPEASRGKLADAARKVFDAGRAVEARSVEINPLVVLADGRVVAADCRMTIDDYAVFRHPELGIEIARELDHPPTALERIAYRIEQQDHRGTFFFARMNTQATPASKGLIGFHGAGGGGSMMSMDAIAAEGFTLANFCDTSGNPSVAKVYRAARIILSQPGLVGYFGSGSGVANQEQFWSAYGLAKAFLELRLDIPAVIRLGGNGEDRAVDILTSACRGLSAKVEGYKKNDPPARIAARFATLVEERRASDGTLPTWEPRSPTRPSFVGSAGAASMDIRAGRVWIDLAAWRDHGPAIAARSSGLVRDDHGKPATTLPPDQFATKDNELIACEVECLRDGISGFFVELDMPDLAAPGVGTHQAGASAG
jgi:succinyl-CoA synthetase beta subunit